METTGTAHQVYQSPLLLQAPEVAVMAAMAMRHLVNALPMGIIGTAPKVYPNHLTLLVVRTVEETATPESALLMEITGTV